MPAKTKRQEAGAENYKKGAAAHLSHLQNLKSRNAVQGAWSSLKAYMRKESATAICTHLRLGTALTFDLLNCTLTAERVHKTKASYGAPQIGARFEDHFVQNPRMMFDDGTVIVASELCSQPFKTSDEFPFLCAQPDFRGSAKICKKSENVLIEVKSSKDEERMRHAIESDDNTETTQLRAALAVFGLETGYLVFYLNQDSEIDNCTRRCKVVKNSNFLEENRGKLIAGYTEFLIKIITRYTKLPDYAIELKAKIKKFVEGRCNDHSPKFESAADGVESDKYCPLSKIIAKDDGRFKEAPKKGVGRPKNPSSKFKKIRKTKTPVS
jgi:hypothetical protein